MKILVLLLSISLSYSAFANKKGAKEVGAESCESLAQVVKGGAIGSAAGDGDPKQAEAAQILRDLHKTRDAYHKRLLSRVDPYDFSMPSTDPFFNALTLEEAEEIFNALSYDPDLSKPGMKVRSVLGDVVNFITTRDVKNLDEIKPLLEKLQAHTKRVLPDEYVTRANLYRGSVAIDLLLPLLTPFLPAMKYEEDKKEEKIKDKTEDAQDEEEEDPEPGQQQKPEYPDRNNDNYDPHNKDTKKGRQKAENQIIVAKVNVPGVPYFVLKYFNSVSRGANQKFQVTGLPGWQKQLSPHGPSAHTLKLYLGKKRDVSILMPMGFEPRQLNPKYRGKIVPIATGEYHLMLDEEPPEELEISLDREKLNFTPTQLRFLQKTVGFKEHEWPDELKIQLLNEIRGKDVVAAGRMVEKYLRNHYKYRKGAAAKNGSVNEKDLIEALKSPSFQCDYAAYAMVAIMRDFMQFPCRVVDVYRGQSKSGDKESSYLALPTDLHVMVQCIDGAGNAHAFDPTPKNPDEKDKNKDSKNQYHDNSMDFDDPPDDDNDNSDGELKELEDNTEKHKKTLKTNTEQSLGEKTASGKGSGKVQGKPEEKPKPQDNKEAKKPSEKDKVHDNQAESPIDPNDFRDNVSDRGNTSLKPEDKVDGALENRARMLYFREAFDPRHETKKALHLTNMMDVDPAMDHNFKPWIKDAKIAFEARQRPAPEALTSLGSNSRKQSPVTSFQRLVQLEDRLDLYQRTLDPDNKPGIQRIITDIRKVKDLFQSMNEDSEIETAMAEKFYRGLPPHARQLVKRDHHIESIGNNMPTKAMLKKLQSGGLVDYNLMRILYPMTDFIMDSVPTPAFRVTRTSMQDPRYATGQDFLLLKDLTQAHRAIKLDPHEDDITAMLRNAAFLPLRLQRINVPDPGGKTNPKRVTIAGYDTSGSMDGDPGDFQAALLSAFTDRALSDRVGAQYMHQCLLMGFGDNVHTEYPVRNSDEAYNVIQNYRQNLKNTGAGTDIMAFLTKAIQAIIDAQEVAGEPLASANIILMSDGGANVNVDELRRMMAKIDKRTPIKFMFIGINGTNPDLIELSKTVREAGAAEALYTYFSSEQISELMKESKIAPKPNKKRELYTSKGGELVPPQIEGLLVDLGMRLDAEMNRLDVLHQAKDPQYWHQEMARTPIVEDTKEQTKIKLEFSRLRGLIERSDVLKEKKIVRTIAHDVMSNFNRTFGKPFSPLMLEEREQINHLLTAAIYHAAGKRGN